MDKNQNSLRDFIFEEYNAKVAEHLYEQDLANQEASLKTVTVRLSPDQLGTIDGFARYFSISRQRMLEQLIEGGIDLSFSALADAEVSGMPLYPDMTDEEKKEHWNAVRSNFIKEICP